MTSEKTTKAWSQELAAFRDPAIERCLFNFSHLLDQVASDRGIDRRYLEIQVRLHFPFFSKEEKDIHGDEKLLKTILDQISSRIRETASLERDFISGSGAYNFPIDAFLASPARDEPTLARSRMDTAYNREITFSEVSENIGITIQNQMHYIHSFRKDTLNHFGFFLEGYELPFCYAAVSLCDRKYQREPVKNILPNLQDSAILSMTRAYSFPPLPKNTMSKLFQEIANFYSKKRSYGAIITAINPLLGFKGSTFLGSSYIPYATSPMRYIYTEDGCYVNRRHPEAKMDQQSHTPPIVWLARGLTRSNQRKLDFSHTLHTISQAEYDAG